MTTQLISQTLDAIDELNQQDPNQELVDGINQPKELIYGQRMSDCLNAYWPDANECLQIAVRAQHVIRWQLKRSEFPEGKAGYLKWRSEQGKIHAKTTHAIMLAQGYSEHDADKTAAILRKEKLKSNSDSQTLEDVACLVFLQHYFGPFAAKHSEEKIIRILQLTWRKMSERGHEIALSVKLPEHLAKLVEKALS